MPSLTFPYSATKGGVDYVLETPVCTHASVIGTRITSNFVVQPSDVGKFAICYIGNDSQMHDPDCSLQLTAQLLDEETGLWVNDGGAGWIGDPDGGWPGLGINEDDEGRRIRFVLATPLIAGETGENAVIVGVAIGTVDLFGESRMASRMPSTESERRVVCAESIPRKKKVA